MYLYSVAILHSRLLTTHHATAVLNVQFVYSESRAYSFFFKRMEKFAMLRYIEIDANRRRLFFP